MRESESMTTDQQYQTVLTQRTVARAALHLGIDTLPQNTLTVLQDSLTQYLERIGSVLGNSVEMSGRASDHVNVLDAIRAVEDCSLVSSDSAIFGGSVRNGGGAMDATTSAGTGVAIGNGFRNGTAGMNGSTSGRGHAHAASQHGGDIDGGLGGGYGDWSDLARFLYGDDFLHSPALGTNQGETQGQSAQGQIQGQVQGQGQSQGQAQSQNTGDAEIMGWNAPLDDYDSIPMFPVHVVGSRMRNDERASTEGYDEPFMPMDFFPPTSTNASRLKKGAGIDEPQRNTGDTQGDRNTPLSASSVNVGSVSGAEASKSDKDSSGTKGVSNTKRKRDDELFNIQDNKRSKTFVKNGDAKLKAEGEGSNGGTDAEDGTTLPSYIPRFLPPFPPKHTYTKSSKSVATTVEDFQPQEVRSSLVQLGHSYWGQIAPLSTSKQDAGLAKVETVPVDFNAVNAGGGARRGADLKVAVKPVARASNARVSRILEGSLDVHS